MKVQLKDHMSRELLTIGCKTSVSEAYHMMTNEWIRHLPVISGDDEETIIGIVSDRDLLCAKTDDVPVDTVMSPHIKYCDISTPIKNIIHSMIDNKISSYLITQNGAVQGIVTTEDMLILLSQLLTQKEEYELDTSKFGWNSY